MNLNHKGRKVRIINTKGFIRDDYKYLEKYIDQTGIIRYDYGKGNGHRLSIKFDDDILDNINDSNGRLCFRIDSVEFIDDTYIKPVENDKVEFKIGDAVKLTSKYNGTGFVGGCYSSYPAFFQENNMLEYGNRYTSNKSMESGIYKIVGIGKHRQDNSIVYVLENNNTYKIYLFSNVYNEMTKEINSIEEVQKQVTQKPMNKVYTYEMIPHKINWRIIHNGEIIDQVIDSGTESYKLIINGNTTIVILDDGSKGIAKCLDSDVYDMDKGIDIAYTKAIIKSSQKKLKMLIK